MKLFRLFRNVVITLILLMYFVACDSEDENVTICGTWNKFYEYELITFADGTINKYESDDKNCYRLVFAPNFSGNGYSYDDETKKWTLSNSFLWSYEDGYLSIYNESGDILEKTKIVELTETKMSSEINIDTMIDDQLVNVYEIVSFERIR